ncbi:MULTISPECIES: hypothetical protein [Roseofilum]|uniref:Uncharacterized protein n=1 Tax=Roseofilum capinflatum BLCC-M114 TaxID=3022440 RepID=A0ABT7B9V6_9CYAN|nr:MULTISPECIES: hypothetical protein [Roseofilum]MBP0032463.1 hypothetical protein [Roseofilum sp. Belize BBD 4]MDJ1175937.1 hypothetical protein [Roseofilum capinflatum BLCC-M114]
MTIKHKIWVISSFLSLTFASSPIAVSRDLTSIQPINTFALTKENTQCSNTLASVEQKISQNQNIPITFDWEDMPDQVWGDATPAGAEQMLHVTMGRPIQSNTVPQHHPRTLDVMNSSKFRNDLATEIIDSCPGVGLVIFGLMATDYSRSHGVVNSKVQEFQCFETSSRRDPIPWGFERCL